MAEIDGSATTTGIPVMVRIRANSHKSRIWRINILGPTGSKCALYVGAIAATQFRDGSRSGQQDIAEYPNGLNWPSGMPLFFQWDLPGSASVHVEFEDPG